MRDHNVCFHGKIGKLSLLPLLIWNTGRVAECLLAKFCFCIINNNVSVFTVFNNLQDRDHGKQHQIQTGL